MPLQPTLGAMIQAIAREYGLPSTVGVGVYLVTKEASRKGKERDSASSSSSISFHGDDLGPLISSHTWSTLFGHYIRSAPASRSSTPSTTPVKGPGSLGKDMPFPASPLSLVGKVPRSNSAHGLDADGQHTPTKSRSADPSRSTALSAELPPTPASASLPMLSGGLPDVPTSSPVVGSIEFDIDPDIATWWEDWHKSGAMHRRKTSTLSDTGSGLRELRLRPAIKSDVPRFLREVDPNTSITSSNFTSLDDNDSQDGSHKSQSLADPSDSLAEIFPSGATEFAILRHSQPSHESRRLSIHDSGNHHIISASASVNYFPDPDSSGSVDEEKPVDEGMEMLAAPEDLLSSAMPGDAELAEIHRRALMDGDKRGSGLVMSEQLDTLEKIMRQLSPREIRLTSPKELTPRMAAKVAHLQFPSVPNSRQRLSKPASSPLINGFTDPSRPPSVQASLAPALEPSTEPRLPQKDFQDDLEEPSMPKTVDLSDSPRPSWPSVPFARNPEYPSPTGGLPGKAASSKPGSSPISAETLKRMQDDLPARPARTPEWRPRRPQRPPSPNLGHQRTLSHSLSPEHTSQLAKSPPTHVTATAPTPESSQSPAFGSPDEKDKQRRSLGRKGSGIRGLRQQMSAKNLNIVWKKDEQAAHALPQRSVSDTVGLFKGGVQSDANSSFASLTSAPRSPSATVSSSARGSASIDAALPSPASPSSPATAQHPAKSQGFASRMFGGSFSFGRSRSTSERHEKSDKHERSEKVEKEKRSSRKTSAGGNHDLNISSPLVASFQRLPNSDSDQALAEFGAKSPSMSSPQIPSGSELSPKVRQNGLPGLQSPASPHSVRRKPVPAPQRSTGSGEHSGIAMYESKSMVSMASFVLEDPPRRKGSQKNNRSGESPAEMGMAM